VRVVDFSQNLPGPYATLLLAQLGADVVKVEPPGGDPARAFPRLFAAVNQGKRSECLDLKSEAGRTRARALVKDAGVVVEGWRPGVAARLGVGYGDVCDENPDAVYVSISGYGQAGDRAGAPGHDLNYQAEAGILAVDPSYVPGVPVLPVADMASGLFAAFAACAALLAVARGHGGRFIDVSMADVALTWTLPRLDLVDGGDVFTRTPHYGVYACADGRALALGIVHEQHFWRSFCQVVGLDALAAATYDERCDDPLLRGVVAEAVAGWPRDELLARLQEADVPASAVLMPWEALGVEAFVRRGTVQRTAGAPTIGHPARYTPGGAAGPLAAAPALGEGPAGLSSRGSPAGQR
jgi:crotonobetainyl-CoA:carnitine CoA-transferase CaiB-like acyl-CoA transferase